MSEILLDDYVHNDMPDIIDNPILCIEYLKKNLPLINRLSNKELDILIKATFSHIVLTIIEKNDIELNKLFAHERIADAITRYTSSNPIEYKETMACNKIIYSYLTDNDISSGFKITLLAIGKMINRQTVMSFNGISVSEDVAIILTVARYSTDDEGNSIKRINNILARNLPGITFENLLAVINIITCIYKILFSRATSLFNYTMFDVYDETEEWITDDIMEAYSAVGVAVLDVLNTLEPDEIYIVLKEYADNYRLLYNSDRTKVRYSMHCLSEDYGKINRVVEYMTSIGINIP